MAEDGGRPAGPGAERPAPAAAAGAQEQTVHATCIVIGEAGVLICGPSGAGKSTFARLLLAIARLEGRFGRLVSDDRTRLCARHGRLLARTVAAIAGRIEARGIGIVDVPHEGCAVVRLVVELSTDEPSRWPEPDQSALNLCGIVVSRLHGRSGAPLAHLVLAQLDPSGGAQTHNSVTA